MQPKLIKHALRGLIALVALVVPALAMGTGYQVSSWTFGDTTSLDWAVNRGTLDEVSVDWYLSRSDASLDTSDEDLSYVALAHSKGLRVLATVSNYSVKLDDFDSRLAHVLLNSPKLRDRHVANICRLCVKKGFDGIDLDWESVLRADRSRFTRFVRALSGKLHQHGKMLSIAVSAKTSEPGDWFGAQSEDYAKLGAAVDEFKIMTYDYSGSWSEPGPIAPPSWADQVLTFAESVVPSAKIMMGVPFYGYDWQGQNTTSLVWTDVQVLISKYSPTIVRDASGEATFQYTDDSGNPHTVFFQDRQAIQVKLLMLRALHPNIRGIAIWCMGGESDGFWDEIAAEMRLSSRLKARAQGFALIGHRTSRVPVRL